MKNFKLIIAVLTLIISSSCSDEQVTLEPESQTLKEDVQTEEAFRGQTGEVESGSYLGMDVQYTIIENEAVYEGDIILDQNDIKEKSEDFISEESITLDVEDRSAGRTDRRWKNNTVPFLISKDLSDKQKIFDAIAEWENKTSIRFVERTDEKDYILFVPGKGCSSSVGRIGGRQIIRVANWCKAGSVAHEIGHAMGLWHEQSRSDREDYITINYNNIKDGMKHNFSKYSEGKDYTGTLDFGSLMMYSSYAFSKNGKPTITKLNGKTYRVQRNGLSAGDIAGILKMYPKIGGDTPKYVNGEYYTIDGVRVYRYNDLWWFYSKKKEKWRKIVNKGGTWFFVS